MEEEVTTRYVFMMMLALSDSHGDVIGTDIAIARMMNVSKSEFTTSISQLMLPDNDSNSPDHDGRRIIPSENGRGYRVVNYLNYRALKSDDEKREYMREYMRKKREIQKEKAETVKSVNFCKTQLSDVTHTEAEAEAESNHHSKRQEFPTVDQVKQYASSAPVPISEPCAIAFYDTQEAAGWITKHGHPIADWRAALRRYASHWNQNESKKPNPKNHREEKKANEYPEKLTIKMLK